MVVSEAAHKIKRFERRVMWRERLLSLQDNLSIALFAGGILSASIILYAKIRLLSAPPWLISIALFSLVLAAVSVRWYLTRSTERDSAFRIDGSLQMEDRLTTARSIIERGGPEREIESALIDEVAERLSTVKESSLVPYRFTYQHALSFVGLIAIIVSVLIPQRALPGGEALIAEQADVQSAGEKLEQVAQDVIRELPSEVETSRLATEQAELGRALRRSSDTRAEALKKISELEGRIRERHDYLSSTRADEIVSLAEKRLRAALTAQPKGQQDKGSQAKSDSAQSDNANPPESGGELLQKKSGDDSQKLQPQASKISENANRAQSTPKDSGDKQGEQSSEQNSKSSSVADNTNQRRSDSERGLAGNASSQQTGQSGKQNQLSSGEPNSSQEGSQPQDSPVDSQASGDTQGREASAQTSTQPNNGDKTQEKTESKNGLSGMMTEQAAKAMPQLSEHLLKNAQQMRLDQLKPEDIRRIAQAAEQLARDLAPIAQSEEFRRMAEQLANRVDAEQLERMARELLKQEDLRKELQAAARLLAENRQIKEIVSGLAKQVPEEDRQRAEELRREQRGEGDPSSGRNGQNGGGAGAGQGNQSNKDLLGLSTNQPAPIKGKDTRLSGNMQKRQGGEYLFLQARPGVGAVRAPYSSAYPRYRREAERSVERSQVPAHLRSLVRNYFDVINPDAGKQQ